MTGVLSDSRGEPKNGALKNFTGDRELLPDVVRVGVAGAVNSNIRMLINRRRGYAAYRSSPRVGQLSGQVVYPGTNEFQRTKNRTALRPMLCCVATALANKAASPASFLDNFGGNVQLQRHGRRCNTDAARVRAWALLFLGTATRSKAAKCLAALLRHRSARNSAWTLSREWAVTFVGHVR